MSSSPRIRIPQSMSYFDVTEYRPWDSRGKDRNGFTGRVRSISRIRLRSICWQAGAGQAPPCGFALNNQAGSWSGWTNHAANGQTGGRRRRRESQSWARSAPALRGCQFVLRQAADNPPTFYRLCLWVSVISASYAVRPSGTIYIRNHFCDLAHSRQWSKYDSGSLRKVFVAGAHSPSVLVISARPITA